MMRDVFKRGFTIIEVILVLTITVALLVGLLATTGTTLARQRYHDSVTGFRDFLQRQFSLVANVQNDHHQIFCEAVPGADGRWSVRVSGDYDSRGRSNCLIYGRLLEFGLPEGHPHIRRLMGGHNHNSRVAHSYVRISTIIGAMLTLEDIQESGLDGVGNTGDIGAVDCDTGMVNTTNPELNTCMIHFGSDMEAFYLADLTRLTCSFLSSEPCAEDDARGFEFYQLEQGASLVRPHTLVPAFTGNEPVEAAIFIMRSPISGAVRTFIFNDGAEVGGWNSQWNETNFRRLFELPAEGATTATATQTAMRRPIDFCIASPDIAGVFGGNYGDPRMRRMVSIAGGATGPSAVQIMPLDMTIEQTHGAGRWNSCSLR